MWRAKVSGAREIGVYSPQSDQMSPTRFFNKNCVAGASLYQVVRSGAACSEKRAAARTEITSRHFMVYRLATGLITPLLSHIVPHRGHMMWVYDGCVGR